MFIIHCSLFIVHRMANFAGTRLAQIRPCVNARIMPIAPEEFQRVTAHRANIVQRQTWIDEVTHNVNIGRRSHVFMPAFALRARANRPQARKWVFTHMPIFPCDGDYFFRFISFYASWSCFCHFIKSGKRASRQVASNNACPLATCNLLTCSLVILSLSPLQPLHHRRDRVRQGRV